MKITSLFSFVLLLPTLVLAQEDVTKILLQVPAPVGTNIVFEAPDVAANYDNPPADDAPLEELIEYWSVWGRVNTEAGFAPFPSQKIRERVYEYVRENPGEIDKFLGILFSSPVGRKQFLEMLNDENIAIPERIRSSFSKNPDLVFIEDTNELKNLSLAVYDSNGGIVGYEPLFRLAVMDPDGYREIAKTLIKDTENPMTRLLTIGELYVLDRKALDETSASKWRAELVSALDSPAASPLTRIIALNSLARGGNYPGLKDWYIKQLKDRTKDAPNLVNNMATLKYLPNFLPPGEIDKDFIALVDSQDPIVREVARTGLIRSLNEDNPEVVRACLASLTDDNWVSDKKMQERIRLNVLFALLKTKVPKSVPILINGIKEKTKQIEELSKIENPLKTKTDSDSPRGGITTVRRVRPPRTPDREMSAIEVYRKRSFWITALGYQIDKRAIPVLRELIPKALKPDRRDLVKFLYKAGGFDSEQILGALDKVVVDSQADYTERREEWKEAVEEFDPVGIYKTTKEERITILESPLPPTRAGVVLSSDARRTKLLIPPVEEGEVEGYLAEALVQDRNPGKEFVTGLIKRVRDAQSEEKRIGYLSFLNSLNAPEAITALIELVAKGQGDPESFVRLMINRKVVIGSDGFTTLINSPSPAVKGLSVCLGNDPEMDKNVLQRSDKATAAFLACARLIRKTIDLNSVSALVSSKDAISRFAAIKYLESVDTDESRKVLWAAFPELQLILGPREVFGEPGMDGIEVGGMKELHEQVGAPEFVSARFPFGYSGDDSEEYRLKRLFLNESDLEKVIFYDDVFLRIEGKRVVVQVNDRRSRFFTRELSEVESAEVIDLFQKLYLSENLNLLEKTCDFRCDRTQVLVADRMGGRRFYSRQTNEGKPFFGLKGLVSKLRSPKGKVGYEAQRQIPGLKVILDGSDRQVYSLDENGGQLYVLLYDKARADALEKKFAAKDRPPQGIGSGISESKEDLKKQYQEQFTWHRLDKAGLSDPVPTPEGLELPLPDQRSKSTSSWSCSQPERGINEWKGDPELLQKFKDDHTYVVIDEKKELLVGVDKEFKLVRLRAGEKKTEPLALPKGFKYVLSEEYNKTTESFIVEAGNEIDSGEKTYNKEPFLRGETEYFILSPESFSFRKLEVSRRVLCAADKRSNDKKVRKWVAVSEGQQTQVGIFDAATLAFETKLEVTNLRFDTPSFRPAKDGKSLYVVHRGHLLWIPLEEKRKSDMKKPGDD